MTDKIIIRPGRVGDIDRIVCLEKNVYGPLGMDSFGEEHVRSWFQVHSDGVLIAETASSVVGFLFYQKVKYARGNFKDLLDYYFTIDDGFVRKSHDPCGNAFYCVTVCSILRGAGLALSKHMLKLARQQAVQYIIGHSRISGFGPFFLGLTSSFQADEQTAARWYVQETARMVGAGIIWSLAVSSDIGLPHPSGPDPTLRLHLSYPNAEVVAVTPDGMRDPDGRNYSVLVISELTPAGDEP